MLQIHKADRDLTLRKAKAIHVLCDGFCLQNPGRLLAIQIASVANNNGLVDPPISLPSPRSETNEWFPSAAGKLDELYGLRGEINAHALANVAHLRRATRRKAAVVVRRVKTQPIVENAMAELASEYPFSNELTTRVLPAVLEGKMSPDRATELLFAEAAEPERFVDFVYSGAERPDKHHWTETFGDKLLQAVLPLRQFLIENEIAKESRPEIWSSNRIVEEFGPMLVDVSADYSIRLGLSLDVLETIKSHMALMEQLPFANFLASIFPPYLADICGARRDVRSPRRSDGGDLFHGMALPYCDLWRSDGYFADLVGRSKSTGNAIPVSRLVDLPREIERLQGESRATAS